MTDRLEELMRQRKEIDEEIKRLKGREICLENAKFFVVPFRGGDCSYRIAIKAEHRWSTIASAGDMTLTIERVKRQIEDLNALLAELEGSE